MEKSELQRIRKSLGLKIRELRKGCGYSQEAFAHECGIHRTYMGDVERGERNIALDNIARISKTLDMSLSELLKGVE